MNLRKREMFGRIYLLLMPICWLLLMFELESIASQIGAAAIATFTMYLSYLTFANSQKYSRNDTDNPIFDELNRERGTFND